MALIRLRKPLSHYIEQYGDPAWGTKKLLSLMEKQRNRGRDGAGIATVQFNMPTGREYLQHIRSAAENAIDQLYEHVMNDLQRLPEIKNQEFDKKEEMQMKNSSAFIAEALLGHVRYAKNSEVQLKNCQPFVRTHSIASRHFAIAGNFNMTNIQKLYEQLEEWGLSLTNACDTQVILEFLAHHLDKEYKRVASDIPLQVSQTARSRVEYISKQIDLSRVLSEAAEQWDGGYVFCGILGSGDVFICRDPAGIRPGYYFVNEEVMAAASERVALMDAFDLSEDEVLPVAPGHIVVMKRNGEVMDKIFTSPLPQRHCIFERIYFSKPHDPHIYEERKALGRELAAQVFGVLGKEVHKAIFTYVPHTSLLAYQGFTEEVAHLYRQEMICAINEKSMKMEEIKKLANIPIRTKHLIVKNQKLRAPVQSDAMRKKNYAELYDVIRGVNSSEDTLIVIDDSIISGTTLRDSLIKKLIQLNPKKIIIVSTSPPICYPDYYGISLGEIDRFLSFQAAIALLKERQQEMLIDEVYALCVADKELPIFKMSNHVKKIYQACSLKDISRKASELILTPDIKWEGTLHIIYQTLEGLHRAIPYARGDWYFSGDYPTPGGIKLLNESFMKWYEETQLVDENRKMARAT